MPMKQKTPKASGTKKVDSPPAPPAAVAMPAAPASLAPSAAPVPAAHANQALLRFEQGPFAPLAMTLSPDALIARAKEWNYRLRDRRRWSTRGAGVSELRTDARKFITELGITEAVFERAARARIVQVDLPAGQNPANVALRRLPWEYLLASATRPQRGELAPFTVVRRLRGGRPNDQIARPQRWLMVESAPALLHDEFDFTSEREVIERSARACDAEFRRIDSPTAPQLSSAITAKPQFDVVHLAGFDLHQAVEVMRASQATLPWASTNPSSSPTLGYREGYVLASPAGQPAPIDATSLANLLCSGAAPRIVTCNVYNSAYEIAASMVEAGAQSSIGFQDTFDDQLAEQFFATFSVPGPRPAGIRSARSTTRGSRSARGACRCTAAGWCCGPRTHSKMRS